MARVDNEEKRLVSSYERSEWKSVKGVPDDVKRYAAYAHETLRKNQRINIRISQRDLENLQTKAIQEGIPYQTLISSVLHKYVSGRLVARA